MLLAGRSDVGTRCLRRWRLSWKSGARRHWGSDRSFQRPEDTDRQVDRPPRQQHSRIRRAACGLAIRARVESYRPARLLRFGSGGPADEGRVRLPQSTPVFP